MPSDLAETIPTSQDADCGWCGRSVALQRVTNSLYEVSRRDSGMAGRQTLRIAGTYACPRLKCHRPSLIFFDVVYSSGSLYVEAVLGQVPTGRAVPMDDLPPEIQIDRLEAWACFHAQNFRAAIIMGRAAVQRAVRLRKAEGAGLKQEINDLVRRGVITTDLGAFAHEVRIAGDDAAHPEDLGSVTRDDAEESLRFLDGFLEVAVAMPARSDRRQAARKSPP